MQFAKYGIPGCAQNVIADYINKGFMPGGFLEAVITNDLIGAVEKADNNNVNLLPNYVRFFYNEAPATCWGTADKMMRWVRAGGALGMAEAEKAVEA